MSGGSYHYLCQLFWLEPLRFASELEAMQQRLAGLHYGKRAAAATAEVLKMVREFEPACAAAQERLGGVWKAVEWWDSCDWSEDEVIAAVREFEAAEDARSGT